MAPARGLMNTDPLSVTEWLITDVLAARCRLGEAIWTFPERPKITKAIAKLEAKGLVFSMHGVTDDTVRAGLTDDGVERFISPGADSLSGRPVMSYVRRFDRLITPFIGGYIVFLIVSDYGWWSLAIIPGCLALGIIVFEGIARFYIGRRMKPRRPENAPDTWGGL